MNHFHSIMEDRRWEELELDCLAIVFGKVGLESLVLDVPFVCKSWHKASLHPECWKILDFSVLEPDDFVKDEISHFSQKFVDEFGIKFFSVFGFIKCVLRRSCKSAMEVTLPRHCMELEVMDVLLDECPSLKKLSTQFFVTHDQVDHFSKTVVGLKLLEDIHVERFTSPIDGILKQVSLHCKSLMSFSSSGLIEYEEALAIVTFLPNIKCLTLKSCLINRQELKVILQGCKHLEFLEASNCSGFAVDDELMKLSSHIKHVNITNAKPMLFALSDEQRELLLEELNDEMEEMYIDAGGFQDELDVI